MNLKSFILAFIAIVMMAIPAVAEAPQEVTLTVSSDGPSKEDAIKNALRSAIEQAFGAFVSANTTILNDEIVKDEIVTVSNGSIKEYKEISAVQTDNGNHFVTLTATVSLPNLITYAKSHGSECEFAGNTFGMEMKLFELQKENERKVLENLLKQLEVLIPATMSWTLDISEPVVSGDSYEIEAKIKWLDANYDDYKHRLGSANLPEEALEWPSDYRDIWKKYKKQYNGNNRKFSEDVSLARYIQRDKEEGIKYFNEFTRFIYDNLSAISLSDEDNEVWRKRGMRTGSLINKSIYVPDRTNSFEINGVSDDHYIDHRHFLLRSDENAEFFKSELDKLIGKCFANFVIKDNTGQISDLMVPTIAEIRECSNCNNEKYYEEETSPLYGRAIKLDYNYPVGKLKGTGIFQVGCKFRYNQKVFESLGLGERYLTPLLEISFTIPKEDIGKYSKFWIEPKQ